MYMINLTHSLSPSHVDRARQGIVTFQLSFIGSLAHVHRANSVSKMTEIFCMKRHDAALNYGHTQLLISSYKLQSEGLGYRTNVKDFIIYVWFSFLFV